MKIRETIAPRYPSLYAMALSEPDNYIVRHDIFDGRTQWTIDHIVSESKLTNEEDLNRIRKLSADLFSEELEKAGVRVADLKKMPDFSSGPIRLRL